MPHLIPLSRLARLVGASRAQLQKMVKNGELATFDGQVDLDEVLRHFPDVKLNDEAELQRVEEIKEQALRKKPQEDLPDAHVLHERLRLLGRDYAALRVKLSHYERTVGWIAERLSEAEEEGETNKGFTNAFMQWLRRQLETTPADLERLEVLLAKERIMRVTNTQVTLLPGQQTFEVNGNESLLEAGLRAGLPLPYGCSNGTCGECKCRVAKGEVVKVRPHDFMLTETEQQQGYTLACSYTPVSDINLEVATGGPADIPEQTIRARVRDVEVLGGQRIAVHLMTSRAERLRYLAGQLVEINVNGKRRTVPAASCPCDERRLEVHVQCHTPPDDESLRGPFASLMRNTDVTVRGPLGSFVLDDASQRAVVLVAQGAGFAQIKSMLQHALSLENAPSVTMLRLASDEGLYQENLLKSYANALDDFRYIAFDATSPIESVIEAVMRETSQIADTDIYAAGSAAFISALHQGCSSAGLPEAQWRAETIAEL